MYDLLVFLANRLPSQFCNVIVFTLYLEIQANGKKEDGDL